MINKKNLKKEKIFSIFEILLLITSVITFSYFIGEEFGFVSAEDSTPTAPTLGGAATAVDVVTKVIASTPVPTTAGAGVAGTTGHLAEYGPSFLPSATTPAPIPTANGFWTVAKTVTVNIVVTAVVATALYWATYWIYTGVGGNAGAAHSLAQALATGYLIGGGVGIIVATIWPSLGLYFSVLGGLSVSGVGIIVGVAGALIGLWWWAVAGVHDQKMEAVQFTCSPWQPQVGGANCDKCNKGDLPCTKSKCQSLGAACELLNEGTSNEACSWVNRNDVSPPTISAWDGPLDKTKYTYAPYVATFPGDKGVIIKYKNSSDGCAPAFSRIFYGISLDKLGKCKIDVNRTDTFAEMTQTISNGYLLYNHTILSVHGGGTELATESINLTNGGNYQVFVRCESANGYSNTGTFVFKYCVQSQPDTTAPTIASTIPLNGWFVENNKTSQYTEVYTDKPATCKWSHVNEGYDTMPNNMTCSQSIIEMNANTYYKCSTTLTGLKNNVENDFYFNCKSYPLNAEANRYKMTTNYLYKLTGTQPLVINTVTPKVGSTIKDATQSVKVTLTATTSAGYNQGNAWCSVKPTAAADSSYVLFANTNSYTHSQDLWLDAGSYDYTIKCCDVAEKTGNCATNSTQFNVETDFQPPVVIRVYDDNTQLKIVTDETAKCVYGTNDCSYDFKDGVPLTTTDGLEHTTDWNTNNNFYIKCQDQFGNLPAPDQCSLVARPFSSY